MENTSSAVLGKKRRLSSSQDVNVCSLCDKPAAVSVDMSSSTRRQAKPFCLLHYYTTRAIRQDGATIIDQDVVDQELQYGVQQLFAEAFLEIQQELAHESAIRFQKNADPLAILDELHGSSKARPKTKTPTTSVQGGFMRHVPLPERLLKTQQEQARLQREQVARMTAASNVNPYERRKPSRQSIWHLAMKEPTKEEAKQLAAHRDFKENVTAGVTCSCGSTNVSTSGNVTSRGGDMAKGETWGSKDRGDSLVSRYQCESCGRMWTEED
jgi:hypothetical protein